MSELQGWNGPGVRRGWIALLLLAFLCACQSGPSEATVESIHGPDAALKLLKFTSLTGSRDGGRLRAQILFEAPESTLKLDLTFEIGVPTRLLSGSYRYETERSKEEGTVRERSLTFLGGQSDLPQLGGIFELADPRGSPVLRVSLPIQSVEKPPAGSLGNHGD